AAACLPCTWARTSITVSAAARAAMPWTYGPPGRDSRCTQRYSICANGWGGPGRGGTPHQPGNPAPDSSAPHDRRKTAHNECTLREPGRPCGGATPPNSGSLGRAPPRVLQATQRWGHRSRDAPVRHGSRPRALDWPPARLGWIQVGAELEDLAPRLP